MATYDLVFEGGGAKGMAFVGALHEFEARGHRFDRLLGTSTGAITAILLAVGYRAEEMLVALNERKNGQPIFTTFLGTPRLFSNEEARTNFRQILHNLNLPWVPLQTQEEWGDYLVKSMMDQTLVHHLLSFDMRGGWYAADAFLEWLATRLDTSPMASPTLCFSQMNLLQFYEATGREVSLVASDTSEQRMLVLNHRTAPQCPLLWAARMSMSLPLVWQEIEWRAEWGAYRGEEISGHVVVDGGLLSNFPIELLLSDMPYVTQAMGPKRNNAVLGFLIDESLEVPDAPSPSLPSTGVPPMVGVPNFRFDNLRTFQRINRLIDTATKAHDKMVMESLESMVVRLPAKSYSVTEFDMSDERRDALIQAAREATRLYFDRQVPTPAPLDVETAQEKVVSHIVDHVATRLLES